VVYERAIEELDVGGLRATWSSDLGFAEVDPEVSAIAFAAAEALVDAGGLALVERPISLTDPMRMWLSAGAADLWMDIEKGMYPERSDELTAAPYFGLKATEDFGVDRFARILMRRWKFEDEVAAIFRDVDLLLTPTTAVPAYAAEGPMTTEINGVTVHPGMSVPFTQLGNLAWNPGISLPAGTTSSGLPVGVMITARRHADDVVLRLARLFEQARPWPRVAPGYS
jgi:aspartyl-tRNA(Asn)/glutamyl-tRNA(Gln) amidotransferase subunit A